MLTEISPCYRYRNWLSNCLFASGLLAGYSICHRKDFFGLFGDSSPVHSLEYFFFPAITAIVNTLLLVILADIYQSKWHEKIKRISTLPPVKPNDTALAIGVKSLYFSLLLSLAFLGGYITSIAWVAGLATFKFRVAA